MRLAIAFALALTAALLPATSFAIGNLRHDVFASPTGDDANPGSKEEPVRTFRRALSLVENGGVVTLAGGVYREKSDLDLQRSGTAASPLVIQGAPGEKAAVKGSAEVTGWAPAGKEMWKLEHWLTNSQQLFADGRPLQQLGITAPCNTMMMEGQAILPPVGKGLADLKRGTFWYDAPGQTLYCMLPDGSDPNRHLMEASVAERLLSGWGKSYVTVRNLTFMHSNQTAKGWMNGMVNLGDTHWIIEDCDIEYGDFAGLHGHGNDHIIRRCVISNNGCLGIVLNGSDQAHGWKLRPDREPMNIVCEDLVIANNNYRRFNPNWQAGGMKCIPSCRNVTVRRCRVTDNYGPGIWFDSDLGGIVIEDNLVSGNGTGIFCEISMPAPNDAFGARIRNNRVINTVRQGIYISASERALVERNTCYNNWADIVMHGMPRSDGGRKWREWGNVVRDNILFGGGEFGHLVVYTGEGAGENVIDGNYYVAGPDGAVKIGLSKDTGYYSRAGKLTTLLQGAGFEAHGLAGGPPCMDPKKGDFRLRPDSAAAGKGWDGKTEAAPEISGNRQ